METKSLPLDTVLIRRADNRRYRVIGTDGTWTRIQAVEGPGRDLIGIGRSGSWSTPSGFVYDIEAAPAADHLAGQALVSGLLVEAALAPQALADHASDADCLAAGTVDPETGDCTACGVSGGDPCPLCDGERYHGDECHGQDGLDPEVVVEAVASGNRLLNGPCDEEDVEDETKESVAPSMRDLMAGLPGEMAAKIRRAA